MADASTELGLPLIEPLGDRALLVRFAATLSDAANRATIAFTRRLREQMPQGVSEIDPNLVSVLLKYHPTAVGYEALAGEVRLLLAEPERAPEAASRRAVRVAFGGEAGPDLDAVAEALGLTPEGFVAAHCARPLRVLAVGFAPGFVYCGFHPEALTLPRQPSVQSVPAGTILFAAGMTAITATAIPTGWHVIGRTAFCNFDATAEPPTTLGEGDEIAFEAIA